MTYNLYVDVFFGINFVMDFFVLSILRTILKSETRFFRIWLGSLIGALWAVFLVVCPVLPMFLQLILTYTGISILMVKAAFGVRGVRETGKALAGLYMTTVTTGGFLHLVYRPSMPWYIILPLLAGAYFGIKFLWLNVMEMKKRQNHMYRVTLCLEGRSETVTALMDTGNHLYEPVSHKPVHILTYESLSRLCSQMPAVIYIPYQAVGVSGGLLPAVFLDWMEVNLDGKMQKINRPLIGVYKERLSPSGEYQMLLHEEL